ncbi:ATP-binding protein [Rubrivirga sp.]|uniref:PAS domain-containing sensor histidine kinase n=1 Tax=Rubrivirga sp. TaxID=1885344 RepID=UPI003C781C6B
MFRSLSRWFRSIAPHFEVGTPDTPATRTLRISLVLVIVGTPVFGVVYALEVPHLYDPPWLRAAVVAVAAVLLVASYRSPALRERSRAALVVITHLAMVWFFALLVVNDLDPNYALGFLFVALAAALVYSLAWDRPGPMLSSLATATGYAVVAIAMADPGDVSLSPVVFLVTSLGGASVVFLAFYGRLHTASELAESRRSLAKAEDLAMTGAWTYHVPTGRETWSDGTYRILGVESSSDGPPSFSEFTHPADLEVCSAERERLFATGQTSDFRYRAVRTDGSVRWIRSVSELVLDGKGRPLEARGVIADVTEQVAREADLEAARDAAEAATRAQSEFLANMSHEIRTPLTAIIGFAQMLSEEVPEADVSLVTPIETGGRRLLGTLNSVLDLARMESDQSDLDVAPTDVVLEAEDVVAMLRPHAEGQGLTLDLEVDDETAFALVDSDAFGRVLTNLLSNAIKFTDEGGVGLSIRSVGGCVEVRVSDTGRGMTSEFLVDLFEPFRQASTGWSRSHEGTGLGMTITQRLVAAMDGSIEVESAVGLGTTCTVRLPSASAPPEDLMDDGVSSCQEPEARQMETPLQH